MLSTSSESRTWFDIFRCVSTELFPALSIMMRQCLDEILKEKPDFKLDDFGKEAMEEIMEKLKQKRTMNNYEIEYLQRLIQRASTDEQPRLVLTFECCDDMVKQYSQESCQFSIVDILNLSE